LTEENLRGFLKNPDDEIRLIAELDGEPVGLGALVVDNSELPSRVTTRMALLMAPSATAA
jgi:hypothetical protein